MKNILAALALSLTSALLSSKAQATEPQAANPPIGVLSGDYFPILSWDLPMWSSKYFSEGKGGLRSLAEGGVNVAAFVRPEHLQQINALHTKCILAPEKFPISWATLSDQEITRTVKQLVDEGKDDPAVVGFFLADEPGEPDFAGLAKAVAAVKKFAPTKLAYASLFPNYATLGAPNISQLGTATYTEYLEQYIRQVHPEFISYDNYQIQYSHDQQNRDVASSYYLNLLEVRRVAMEHRLPFWVVCASAQITAEFPPPSPADLAMQAYTSLAAGANGFTWYTYVATANPGYYFTPVQTGGGRSAVWSYLKMVNEQMAVIGRILRPCKSTGVYFTSPQPADGLPSLPGKWITSISCPTPVMVGEFTSAKGEKFALIVNLSLRESSKFTFTVPGSGKGIQVVSPADGSLSPADPDHLWLSAGQGMLLKLP